MNSSKQTDLRRGAKFSAILALACALPLQLATAQELRTELPYQSPFQHYQAFTDLKLVPWRASNEQVEKVGGWRSYAKQAQQPDPAPPTPGVKPEAVGETAPAKKDRQESKHQHHRSQP